MCRERGRTPTRRGRRTWGQGAPPGCGCGREREASGARRGRVDTRSWRHVPGGYARATPLAGDPLRSRVATTGLWRLRARRGFRPIHPDAGSTLPAHDGLHSSPETDLEDMVGQGQAPAARPAGDANRHDPSEYRSHGTRQSPGTTKPFPDGDSPECARQAPRIELRVTGMRGCSPPGGLAQDLWVKFHDGNGLALVLA